MSSSTRESRREQNQTKTVRSTVRNLPQKPGDALKVIGGTTKLMLACASGQHIKEATLVVRGN